MKSRRTGLPAAALWLGLSFLSFLALLPSASTLGGTTPWSFWDICAGIPLLVGVYCAADHCRALSVYFGFGAAAGLFYVECHWPGWGTCAGMSPALTVWTRLFLQYLGLCVGLGVLCGFVAAVRHRRIDAVAKRSAGRCRNCGYLLYGLPEPRCPECGEPFDPARLAGERPAKGDDLE